MSTTTYSPKAIVGVMRLVLMYGFILGAAWLLILTGRAWDDHRRIIRDWPLVQTRVVSSTMYEDVSRRWGRSPYAIFGVEHRLERVDNHQTGLVRGGPTTRNKNFTYRNLLRKSLEAHPVGSIMSVRQNPNNPAQMSLITQYDLKSFTDVAIMFAAAIGAIVFGLWIGRVGLLIQERIPDDLNAIAVDTNS